MLIGIIGWVLISCRETANSWALTGTNVLFIFICWFICKRRNNGIFDPCFCDPHNASSSILQYISEWKLAFDKIKYESTSSVCFLSWQKPPDEFLKLNVDGSRSSGGLIGAGGVIRDSTG